MYEVRIFTSFFSGQGMWEGGGLTLSNHLPRDKSFVTVEFKRGTISGIT